MMMIASLIALALTPPQTPAEAPATIARTADVALTNQVAPPAAPLPGFPALRVAPPKASVGAAAPGFAEELLIGCVRTIELPPQSNGGYLRASIKLNGKTPGLELQIDAKGGVGRRSEPTVFDPPGTPWARGATPAEVVLLSDAAANRRPVVVLLGAGTNPIRPARVVGVDYSYSSCDN